jgi:hypothetical protein
MQSLQKLVEIGGSALCSEDTAGDIAGLVSLGRQVDQLTELLSLKNGFYAF